MTRIYAFNEIGRLPAEGDNVAIASRRLEAGTEIIYGPRQFTLSHTLLEGHRFAVDPICPEEPLLSWGLPFGIATAAIEPGAYVANAAMLEALNGRFLDFTIPETPNFRSHIEPYVLDETTFQPGQQVEPYLKERTFQGYWRSQRRGVGTRNMIVILGTTSRTGSYARLLEEQHAGLVDDYANIDGIAAVSHTEGDGDDPINNWDFLLRTLAGLVVHPNVGAILIADTGSEQVNNSVLRDFMRTHNYPLDEVVHRFVSLTGHLSADLAGGTAVIKSWLDTVNATSRTPQPASYLNIALQCGGSDAFSGVSGNPLAASVAQEVIRYGGKANLAETDELIGAEPYMLQNVRNVGVARRFLQFIEEFKERVSWHGASAEGNPSGGNRYRGLYNIALKSIGAAMKRAPAVRLDDVVDYAEPMVEPGFYFMNTPGNDLESIAGQVAGGSNMIFFVTGNGSITNFPFVPTIKLVTTTPRFERLAKEMDVNAGAYQDGRSLSDLTADMLDLTLAIASGQPSKGEEAGHAQISIWRNWRQTAQGQIAELMDAPLPTGVPIPAQNNHLLPGSWTWEAIATLHGYAGDQVNLILPTSLCSGQIARLGVEQLNQQGTMGRFVTLVHTEGCGVAMPAQRDLHNETMVSYITHPLVDKGLFLEHGCEKTHNDYMRHQLLARGRQPADYGWASVQADGGIQPVIDKIANWFAAKGGASTSRETVGLDKLRLGIVGTGTLPIAIAGVFGQLARTIVAAGGTAVLPATTSEELLGEIAAIANPNASLAYGQMAEKAGFHLMETPSRHWTETITGLAATGVELILAYQPHHPLAAHPLVPLLQVGWLAEGTLPADFDAAVKQGDPLAASTLLSLVLATASRTYRPKSLSQNHIDFQLTRGLLGISM